MRRAFAVTAIAVLAVTLSAGCATKSEFDQLKQQVGEIQTSVTTLQEDIGKLRTEFAAQQKVLDDKLATQDKSVSEKLQAADAATTAKLNAVKGQMTATAGDVSTIKSDLVTFRQDFEKMKGGIREARSMLKANLENMYTIYSQQARAIEETLKELNRQEEKKTPEPAPEKK